MLAGDRDLAEGRSIILHVPAARAVGLPARAEALDIRDVEAAPVIDHGTGIPGGRDETAHCAGALPLRLCDYGNRVVSSVGDKQRAAVLTERQAIGRAAERK